MALVRKCAFVLLITGLLRLGWAVEAEHGAVASGSDLATRVGVEILRGGGNAVDAAVAVGLAMAVTLPDAGNIGGGGFMIVRMHDGATTVIDYRETAPAEATRDMYLDEAGNYIPGSSLHGWLASGVPGTVAGLAMALEKHGTLSWADLIEPARRLAEEGVEVSEWLAARLELEESVLSQSPESRRIFLNNGHGFDAGDTLVQLDLGETLGRLMAKGPREFYEGETASRIVSAMQANGGLISARDLVSYRAIERDAIHATYRGYEIITMPPPSSGGIALVQMFRMLERFDVGTMGHNSADSLHLLAEVMRRAFRDRAEYPADPAFVSVPVAGLIAREYCDERMVDFDPRRASISEGFRLGRPFRVESPDTTHFSIVDREGNVVSNTYTLNGLFGSGVTVPKTGILLNNELDDFAAKPGHPNQFGLIQGEANAIAPGKRPLSSMTPTIVLRDGQPFLVLGSRGGPKIITQVLQVILNVIDHGMTLQEAVDAPRIHHQWMPDEICVEPDGFLVETLDDLRARGHNINELETRWGDVEAILMDPDSGARIGASDSRMPEAGARGH